MTKHDKTVTAVRPLSFIEDHEVEEAERLITGQFVELSGKPPPRACGYQLCLKLYVRDEKLGQLFLPDSVREADKYTAVAGLVVSVGPQAYKGKDQFGNDRFPEGPWCRVGDWVVIPRYEASPVLFRGVALVFINDDKIQAVIEDPTDVLAAYVSDRT